MSSRFALRGRLFGAGIAAGGAWVDAQIDALQLSFTLPDGHRQSTPLSLLSLRKAGFNDTHWELSWRQQGQAWALLIEDPAIIAPLLANPPACLANAVVNLRRNDRRSRVHRGLGLSAIAVWLGLPLLLILALVLAARPLSAAIAGLIPISSEQRLGEWAFKAQSTRLHQVTGTSANDALAQLGTRLSKPSAYDYRWHIARDPSLNAFAMPGGIVVVNTGLIAAADSAEELAGVLAHEIEHVELRHSLKAMMQQAGLRLTLAAIIGDIGIAGEAAGRLSGLRFSRESEREADQRGLQRLIDARIDPQGMLELFTKLSAQNGASAPAWMSSHPAMPERIDALRAEIAERRPPAYSAVAIDWNAVRASIAD